MIPPGPAVNLVSAGLLLLLAGWVASLRPRKPANVALTAFAVSYAVRVLPANLVQILPPASLDPVLGPLFLLSALASLVGAAAAVALVLALAGRPSNPALAAALAATALLTALRLPGDVLTRDAFAAAEVPAAKPAMLAFAASSLFFHALLFVLLLAALRYAAAEEGTRTRLAILTLALSALAVSQGAGVAAFETAELQQAFAWEMAAQLAEAALLAALWLRNAARDPRPRRPVALACAAPAFFLLGAGVASAFPGEFFPGLARTLAIAVLVMGVLRGQFLEADAKLRWTVSRGTLTAAFVAAFFVASEAAQQFFGDTLGSSYLGIAAAGGLIFAIAPLSRWADRMAARAVPPAAAAAKAAEEDYAMALVAAMRGGRVRPEEEMALARLADRAGLDVATVTRIRQEVAARRRGRAP